MCASKVESLPHHEQLPLCTTRLPYRQGRRLTAVKVYSVNDESNHLLIFGVPSLNLRREARELFLHFGKLLKFSVLSDHPAEEFTETFHACFEKIQSARMAKKMLDTKNFYGGSLHICYAPEMETLEETKVKLEQRRKDVLFRLRNLKNDALNHDVKNAKNDVHYNANNEIIYNTNNENNGHEYNFENNNKHPSLVTESLGQRNEIINEAHLNDRTKLNMSEQNVIYVNKRKIKLSKKNKSVKKSKTNEKETISSDVLIKNNSDIVDCTSVDNEVISNINEALNYNKFGNEIVRKVNVKTLNKIVFNFNKNT